MPALPGTRIIRGNDVARFWSKTKVDGDCIVWTGTQHHYGHGKFMTGPAGQQKTHKAHRWIFERVVGPVGDLHVLHDCDNPPCVKLQHLYAGTQMRNVHDALDRNRRPHIVTPEVLVIVEARVAAGESIAHVARSLGITPPTLYAALARRKEHK